MLMKKLHLNLVYLKYFCDSFRSGSISAAAKLNFVSQSAVSQGINKLELSLGLKLISHQPNRFKVTEEGRRLFARAKDIFKAIERVEDFLADNQGRITFGCTHSFALFCLPRYLKLAKEFLPSLRINFRLGQYFNIKDWIKNGTIDFGILLDNEDLSPFDKHPLIEGTYRLYVAKEVHEPTELFFLLDSEERIETNLLKSRYRSLHGKELPILMEVSSWSVVTKLVQEGLGVGLFPDYIAYANQEIKPVLEELNPMDYTLYALFEKNMEPSLHALQFLELFSKFSLADCVSVPDKN
jgi:DNA-binding transcriptional LysR family regulator